MQQEELQRGGRGGHGELPVPGGDTTATLLWMRQRPGIWLWLNALHGHGHMKGEE